MNMRQEIADRTAKREAERIAALTPSRNDRDPLSVGSALMSVLGMFPVDDQP